MPFLELEWLNIMKKLFLLLTVLPLFFISCSKEESPVLTISQASISAQASGSSTTITLYANNPWAVSGTDWCTVSPSGGEGGEVLVTVTVKENTTYDARNCTLTFSSLDLKETVSVNQDSNFGIVLPKNTYELSCDAQQISVEVKANVTYDVAVDADWIKQNGTKALTSKTFTFDIDKNESYDAREGTIVIKEKNGNDVKTIKIKQAQVDAIIISSKEYSLSNKAQSLEVKLQTNVDLDVVIPDNAKPWISHTSTKALSDKTLVFDIKENEDYSARSCEIIVKKKNGTFADTVRIKQVQKDAIVLSQKEYKLSSDKHSLEVKLQTNVDVEVNIPESAKSWISYIETKALADKVIILGIESNGTYGERASEIYIKDKSSSLQDTITIIQAQNDAVLIPVDQYELTGEAQLLEIKMQANVEFEIEIPENAKSWISLLETKALTDKTLVFGITKNDTQDERVCEINVKSGQGITKSIRIKQIEYVVFNMNYSDAMIVLNDTIKLDLKNSSNQKAIWKSTDENIAKVDQYGNVIGVSKGDAVIEVSSEDGRYNTSCSVTVASIEEIITIENRGVEVSSYVNGIFYPGTKFGWCVKNRSDRTINVKKFVMAYDPNVIPVEYTVNDGEIAPRNGATWKLTAVVPMRSPYCYAVFEYKGVEYKTKICNAPF